MKENKNILIVYISGLFLAVSLQYYLFNKFLSYISEEIVNAWYYGEIINLQEGQILPAITKNQSLLQKSKFINAVVLLDKNDPDKYLFSVGEMTSKISVSELIETNHKSFIKNVGFLKSHVVIPISKSRSLFMIYEFSSDVLRWTFFFTLAVLILSMIYLIIYTKKILSISHEKKMLLASEIRERLTHDLKSPLLSLSSIERDISKIGQRSVADTLKMAITRIRELIDDTEKIDERIIKDESFISETSLQKCDVLKTIQDVVKENEYLLKSSKNIKLEFINLLNFRIYGRPFIHLSELDLKRHLNNLIHNSSEAINHRYGEIKITLMHAGDKVEIQIRDNGKGIAFDIIGKIGQKGFTQGKVSGHGFGIYYLKKNIQDLKGHLDIQSELRKGTLITISLPICETELNFIPDEFNQEKILNAGVSLASKSKLFDAVGKGNHFSEVLIKENSLLVFIDDDQVILNLWNEYLLKNSILNKSLFFSNANDFEQWFLKSQDLFEEIQFFFDYQISSRITGFGLIRKFGLERESMIVTNMI